MQIVDGDLVVGADRHDLLGEHVEWVARNVRLLDQPLAHRLRDDGAFEQVAAELREDPALRDGAEVVPSAAHPLQAPRHRLGAFDLDHEVDRTHVDPELERGRRDEAGNLPRLQQLLDLDTLLACERPVVGPRDARVGELVEPHREPLGEAPVVDEHDRRAVLLHEIEECGIDRRPDRPRRRLEAGRHLDAVRRRRAG